MIKQVNENDISECVRVIRDSFSTVADEFGFTAANTPKFTAFATTEDRLKWHFWGVHKPMYAYYDNDTTVHIAQNQPHEYARLNGVNLI